VSKEPYSVSKEPYSQDRESGQKEASKEGNKGFLVFQGGAQGGAQRREEQIKVKVALLSVKRALLSVKRALLSNGGKSKSKWHHKQKSRTCTW